MFHERKFNGLGAQFLRLIDAVALADKLGWRFCVARTRYWNYGCAPHRTWDCYFDARLICNTSTMGCPEVAALTKRQITRVACAVISTKESAGRAAAVWTEEEGVLNRVREYAREVWRVNEETRAQMEEMRRAVGLERAKTLVGVHVRRGDKVREVAEVEIARYVDAIRVVSNESVPVFVASDDGSAIMDVRRRLNERIVLATKGVERREGHVQAEMNRRFMKGKYGSVVELLFEVEVLANASIFVGTFSSNLARLVHVLRKGGEESSVSLDDRWAPGVAWKTFGMEYCRGKGANRVFCEAVGKS